MKKTILLTFSLIYFISVFAQEADKFLYLLYFTDKGDIKANTLNPANYLTDKAIDRRLKQKISFNLEDIPVNNQYINVISKTGATILARSRWFNTVVIEASSGMINEISVMPFVSNIQLFDNAGKKHSSPVISSKLDFEIETINPRLSETTKNTAADLYNYGTAFNQINQLKGQYLHNMGYSGQGMMIAVLDAGFNSVDKMPCFDSLRANNQIKGTRDFVQPGNNVYASTMASHGTSVLSCMAAYISGQMIGTAPKADYWLLRSEVGATESIIEEYYWVSAAEFADSIGVDMINSSLGYTVFKDSPEADHTYADMDGNTTVVTKGADKAAEKGILVVNSAGNEGNSAWKYIGAPADGDSVFTIGSVTATGAKSGFSSVGPTSDGRIKPTVAAQGTLSVVYSPSGLATSSGTSFSSPIMCGITACLWQAFPEHNNMQIIELIKSSASQASKPDSLLGWGIPDFQIASSTLSASDYSKKRNLLVYPNPVADKFTLGFPVSIEGIFNIEIINVQGKVIHSIQRNEGSIRSIQINEIGYLPSGIYLINVWNRSGIFSGKIIKM